MGLVSTNGDAPTKNQESSAAVNLMTFDELSSSGDHSAKELSLRVDNLSSKLDSLIFKLSDVLKIEKPVSSTCGMDDRKPILSSTLMPEMRQTTEEQGSISTGEEYGSMQSNAAKYMPPLDINNLAKSVELYENLFEINGVSDLNKRYRILSIAMLKGNCQDLFTEFRAGVSENDRVYETLKTFLLRRSTPMCRTENLLDELNKVGHVRSINESLRLAQSIRSFDADMHAKMFLYNDLCKNEPRQSNLRDYLKRVMEKPFDQFQEICIQLKAQVSAKGGTYQTVNPAQYPPRPVYLKTDDQQTKGPLCFFHMKFGEKAFKCHGGYCPMVQNEAVRCVQDRTYQPNRSFHRNNAGNENLS